MQEEPEEAVGKLTKQNVIDNLLEFLPAETELTLELPSKGKFYKSCPNGMVKIRPMQFSDEKAVVNSKKSNVDPINMLLERCVENLNTSELLQPDKLYLILKLREISYGEEYPAIVTCDNCSFDNHMNFNLAKLPVEEISEDVSDPMEFELPVLKKKIKIKLPRVKDEDFFKDVDDVSSNLWRFILEIEGISDKSIISEVSKKFPLKDIHKIINIMNPDFGVQTKTKYECQNCKTFNVLDLPITSDFFSVN